MRGVLTKVLIFLGAFLLTTAALAAFYVPGQVKKTRLDVNSVTRLSGDAMLYDGTTLVPTPVKATSTTHSDSELSTDEVVLFQNSSCLLKDPDGNAPDCVSADDPMNRLIAAGTDTFATDRRTGLAVQEFAALPAEAERKEGLVNKFPFDTEQKTYQIWDGYVGRAVDAVFQGEEEIDGLNTYKFLVSVKDGDIEITDGVPGKYNSEKMMWIEPYTGSIMKQTEKQTRIQSSDGQKVLDIDFGFTDETVATNVKDGKANAGLLKTVGSTVPLVAIPLGLISLLAGLFLARRQAAARQADAGTRSGRASA